MLLRKLPTLILLSITIISECAIYTKSPIPFNKLLNQRYGDHSRNNYRPQNFVNLRTSKMKTNQNQMKPSQIKQNQNQMKPYQIKQNQMKPNHNQKEMDSYVKAYIDEKAKQKKSMKMNMNFVPDIPKEEIISENSIRTKKMLVPDLARIHYYMPDQVSGEQIKYTSIIGSSDAVDPINVNTHSDIGVKFVPVYQNNENYPNFFAYGEEYKSYTPVSEVAEETTQPPIEETTKYYNIELATDVIDQNLKINDDFMQSAIPEYKLQHPQHTTDDDSHYASQYEFGYRVRDVHTGNDFGHHEFKDGDSTKGHYHVLLPDGRLQNVRYWAGPAGYHAQVSYDQVH